MVAVRLRAARFVDRLRDFIIYMISSISHITAVAVGNLFGNLDLRLSCSSLKTEEEY